MPHRNRNWIPGKRYFFTVITYNRMPILCDSKTRSALRTGMRKVRKARPFRVEALVLMPDHLHCIWTMPKDDEDVATRWRLIKAHVSRWVGAPPADTPSGKARGERAFWQRRFHERVLVDDTDFAAHCDCVHRDPVKHGLCADPGDWAYSTFGRFVARGLYPAGWPCVDMSTPEQHDPA